MDRGRDRADGRRVGKVIDLNERKKKREGSEGFDAGWDAAVPLVQQILDFMNGDASEDAKGGFEAAIIGVFPGEALLSEVAFRMHSVEVEGPDDEDA